MSGFSRWVTRDRRIPLPTEWQFPFAGSCFAATRMVGFVVGNEREIALHRRGRFHWLKSAGKETARKRIEKLSGKLALRKFVIKPSQ
jgi:hypothetical protein